MCHILLALLILGQGQTIIREDINLDLLVPDIDVSKTIQEVFSECDTVKPFSETFAEKIIMLSYFCIPKT